MTELSQGPLIRRGPHPVRPARSARRRRSARSRANCVGTRSPRSSGRPAEDLPGTARTPWRAVPGTDRPGHTRDRSPDPRSRADENDGASGEQQHRGDCRQSQATVADADRHAAEHGRDAERNHEQQCSPRRAAVIDRQGHRADLDGRDAGSHGDPREQPDPVWRGIDRDGRAIALASPRVAPGAAHHRYGTGDRDDAEAAMTDAPPSVDARIGPVTKTASFRSPQRPGARQPIYGDGVVQDRSQDSDQRSVDDTGQTGATTSTTSEASAASARARPTNAAVRTVARSLPHPVAENGLRSPRSEPTPGPLRPPSPPPSARPR